MAKNRGILTVKFTVPQEIRNGFVDLVAKTRKHIVRQAIRSAMFPARAHLSLLLKQLPTESRQSSGASRRALDMKVRMSTKNRHVMYGIVSVNRKYVEAVVNTQSTAFPEFKARDKDGRMGVYKSRRTSLAFGVPRGINRKTGKVMFTKKFARNTEVQSYYRRGYKSSASGKFRKRVPNKYWHLSEYGFNRNGIRFDGHKFVEQTIAAKRTEMITIFEQKMVEHFRRYA